MSARNGSGVPVRQLARRLPVDGTGRPARRLIPCRGHAQPRHRSDDDAAQQRHRRMARLPGGRHFGIVENAKGSFIDWFLFFLSLFLSFSLFFVSFSAVSATVAFSFLKDVPQKNAKSLPFHR